MKTGINRLVGRDPALAALLGVFSAPGASFGADEFGADEFGEDDDMFADDDFGDDDFGDDFGAAGVARPPALRRPSQAQMARLWQQRRRQAMITARRKHALDPNKYSTAKIERYTFTISEAITLGTAAAFASLSGTADTRLRPQRITMNAPAPMYAFVQDIKVANVSVVVGGGLEDAYNYSAGGVGQFLDLPTIEPSTRVSITGSYTGFVPPGYVDTTSTYFTASFKGPSSLAAG